MKKHLTHFIFCSYLSLTLIPLTLKASSSGTKGQDLSGDKGDGGDKKRRRLEFREKHSLNLQRTYLQALMEKTVPIFSSAHSIYVQGVEDPTADASGFNLMHSQRGPTGYPYHDAHFLLRSLKDRGFPVHYFSDDGAFPLEISKIHSSFQRDVYEFSQMQTLMWRLVPQENISKFFPQELYQNEAYTNPTIAFSSNMHMYRFLASVFSERKEFFMSFFSEIEDFSKWTQSQLASIDESLNFSDKTRFQCESSIRKFFTTFYGDASNFLGNPSWNTYSGTNFFEGDLKYGHLPSMDIIISILEDPTNIDFTREDHLYALSLLKLHAEGMCAQKAILERKVSGTAVEAALSFSNIMEDFKNITFLKMTSDKVNQPLYDTVPVFQSINSHAKKGRELDRIFLCHMILKYGEVALQAIVTENLSLLEECDRASFLEQLTRIKELGSLPGYTVFEDAPHDIDDQIAVMFLIALAERGQLAGDLEVVHSCDNTNTSDLRTDFPLIYQVISPHFVRSDRIRFSQMIGAVGDFITTAGNSIPFPVRSIHRVLDEEFKAKGMMREAEFFSLEEADRLSDRIVIIQAPISFAGCL